MPQALIPVEFLPADETPAALVAWLRQHNVERAGWIVYLSGDFTNQGEEWVFPTAAADNLKSVWDELFGALWRLSDAFTSGDQDGQFEITVATGELRRIGEAYEVTLVEKVPAPLEQQQVHFLLAETDEQAETDETDKH